MAKSRRRRPGDRPRGADPRPPRRERRGGDARGRHGGDAAAEVDGGAAAAGARAQRARAAAPRRRLPARARCSSSTRGATRASAISPPSRWPFLERLGETTGETANVAIPTPGGVARLAQVDSNHPLGRGQLGRQPDPDPRVVDGQGVHGVRGRPAAVRPPRAARPEHDHRHRRPARRARPGQAASATRRRGRSSRPASARPRRPCAARAAP